MVLLQTCYREWSIVLPNILEDLEIRLNARLSRNHGLDRNAMIYGG